MRASGSGISWLLFLLLLAFTLGGVRFSPIANGFTAASNVEMEMVPEGNEELKLSRRNLAGSFEVCALCTCCGGGTATAKRYCLASPCCYAINCNIPNRPFGYCSFTPKTCNCFGCHI
ncbi:hypothetical protein F511_34727 [Dorcoceras hygrometricum]|uniref:DUF7866 domain-containing protein n=1 Tax=Dorcoceras hygrometricum TaxID=472368 RepID=A0A2Z7AYX8_9LAMI|nr:hypothetical protein F511_34727 [Dorcoceras hygrometricum]